MEPVRFDLTDIIDEMDEYERNFYNMESASKYFGYLYYHGRFHEIAEKIENDYIIKEEEWVFMFKKLFAVTCRAISEEESLRFIDKVINMFSKIGIHLTKLDSDAYNECYKMIEYINSIKMAKDINKDLIYGLEVVGSSRDYKDAKNLLRQHHAASNFRDNKDGFFDSYRKNENSRITYDERIAINSFNRFYSKEKELVKKYEK